MNRPRSHNYHPIFKAANGEGPWSCYGCQESVLPGRLTVHHLDENPFNNDPDNLVAMHRGCHNSLHKKGLAFSPEHRAKITAAIRGQKRTPETRAKISAARLGKTMSPESRAKISESKSGKKRGTPSEAQKRAFNRPNKGKPQTHTRFACESCGLVSSGGGIYQHQKSTGHVGKSLA